MKRKMELATLKHVWLWLLRNASVADDDRVKD